MDAQPSANFQNKVAHFFKKGQKFHLLFFEVQRKKGKRSQGSRQGFSTGGALRLKFSARGPKFSARGQALARDHKIYIQQLVSKTFEIFCNSYSKIKF